MAFKKKADTGNDAPPPSTEELFQTVASEVEQVAQIIEQCIKDVEPHRTNAATAVSSLKSAFTNALKVVTGKREKGEKPVKQKTAADELTKALLDVKKQLTKALETAQSTLEKTEVAHIGLAAIVDAAEQAKAQVKQLTDAKKKKKQQDSEAVA